MADATDVRGYLVVTVAEASGRNKDEQDVWDSNFLEGYVKVEVRGQEVPTTKVSSSLKRVLAGQISWQEDIVCDVLEGADELRLMLCKEKRNPSTGAVGQSVVAACGIYVDDILEAVPIDKYFELFKPKNGGDGGFIRVAMNFSTESPEEAADTGEEHPIQPGDDENWDFDHRDRPERGGMTGAVGNQAAPYVPSTSFKKYSKSSADADEAEDDDAAVLTDSGGTKRRIPFGKILITVGAVVGLVFAQRRQ